MLLDTSGLLCCHHRDERQHEQALRLYNSARTLVTHSYVIAEFLPLCHSRGMSRSLAIQFVYDILNDPRMEMVWVGEELTYAALALLRTRADKAYSLCDAVSFVLMRARGIFEALTTDMHFEQEGFIRLLKP